MLNARRGREAMNLFTKKLRDDKIEVSIMQERYHGTIKNKQNFSVQWR